MQSFKKIVSDFTLKRLFWLVLGTAILSFGIHNIHQRAAITEGGVIGLVLLMNHWLGIPASIASPLLDFVCYGAGVQVPGAEFHPDRRRGQRESGRFYRLWESFPPMLPDMTPWPLAAALLGGVFVGIGVGIIVRQGGSSGGDDALALVIHQLTGGSWRGRTCLPIWSCWAHRSLTSRRGALRFRW